MNISSVSNVEDVPTVNNEPSQNYETLENKTLINLIVKTLDDKFSLSIKESFIGVWNRTNIESAKQSTIFIDNVTKDGFDFSVESFYWSRIGFFEGKAEFISENEAVCAEIITGGDIGEEGYVEFGFVLNNNTLTIPEFENEYRLPVGKGVTIIGDYVKEDPYYTNADNYTLIVPNKKIESIIKSLMDHDTYSYFEIAAYDGYISEIDINGYCLYNIETRTIGGWRVYIIIADDNKVYIWCGFNEMAFYTNDEDYINCEIYKAAEQTIFQDTEPPTKAILVSPELEALNLVKNYIAGSDDSVFEPLSFPNGPTYRFRDSNYMIQYDSKIDNQYYLIRQYEFVVDDSLTGEGHTATSNWYKVDVIMGEIIPMFNESGNLNENY